MTEERTLKLELAKTKIGKVIRKEKEYSVLYGGILDIYETVGQIIPLEKEEYTDLLVAFLLNEGKNYMIPSQDEIMEDRQKVLLPESLKRIVTKYKQDERVNQIKTMAKKQIMQKSDNTLSEEGFLKETSTNKSNENEYFDPIKEKKPMETKEMPVANEKFAENKTEITESNQVSEKEEEPKKKAELKFDLKESDTKLRKYAKIFSVLNVVLTVLLAIGSILSVVLVPGEAVTKIGTLIGSLVTVATVYLSIDLVSSKLVNAANIETSTREMVVSKLSTIGK